MKKLRICSFTLILLLHITSANAQKRKTLWFNLIGGVNNSWILFQNAYGNPELEYSPTLGFTGGIGVSYFKDKEWGFTGSVLRTNLGQNYKGIQSGADAERKIELRYFETPLLVMKKVIHTKNPVWLSFGPDIFYLRSAKQEYQRSEGGPLPNPEALGDGDIEMRYNPFDVALNIALSQFYKLDVRSYHMVLISLNTSIGLTDINSDDWKIPQRDGSYSGSHNFYMGIKVYVMFNKFRSNNRNSGFHSRFRS